MEQTFVVEARGIGHRDYTGGVQHSTAPFITPSLRQTSLVILATFEVPVNIFPSAWATAVAMPQEDGSFGWLASSISLHISEVDVSIRSNHLVTCAWIRYNSIADYLAGIIAEWSPEIFGYGHATLIFQKGLPTQEGFLYALRFGAWTETATVEITLGGTGILSDLTLPWMD